MVNEKVYGIHEGQKGKYFLTNYTRSEPWWYNAPDFDRSQYRQILLMDGNVIPGGFYVGIQYKLKPEPEGTGHVENYHDNTDEIVCLFGTDADNPHNLGGEVEFTLNGERHLIDKPCMIFIPKGMNHGPVWFRKIDKPMIQMAVLPTSRVYDSIELDSPQSTQSPSVSDGKLYSLDEGKYKDYFITNFNTDRNPLEKACSDGEQVLFLDKDIVPGVFYMDVRFRAKPDPSDGGYPQNIHDSTEIVLFAGTDPETSRELHANIEVTYDGEKHLVKEPTMIFIPAGTKHGPFKITEVEKPVIQISILPYTGKYDGRAVQ